MGIKVGSIVMRCEDFNGMLAFWQGALGYAPRQPPEGGWVVLRDPQGRGPNISLQRVREDKLPQHRARIRSRLHLDLYADDQHAEVERLVALGAKRYSGRK